MSFALPFPGHQLTNPEGGGVQVLKGATVKSAFELVTVPKALVTITA